MPSPGHQLMPHVGPQRKKSPVLSGLARGDCGASVIFIFRKLSLSFTVEAWKTTLKTKQNHTKPLFCRKMSKPLFGAKPLFFSANQMK